MAKKIIKGSNSRTVRTFKKIVDLARIGDEGTIVVEFAAMQRADLDALNAKEITDEQFCRKIIVGVREIVDENGVEYPPGEQLDMVIGDISLCKLAMDTFNDSFADEKRGN